MNKVKNEESIKPKIMEHPKARQVSSDKVIGIIPIIVQIEVMKIASILDLPASIIASIKGIPLRKLRLILSTRIIALHHDTKQRQDTDQARKRKINANNRQTEENTD